jgi:hypothetical protein
MVALWLSAVAALGGLGLSSCDGKSAQALEPDRYFSRKHRFSIKFPETWKTEEGVYGTTVMSLSPLSKSSDRFQENVNVVVEKIPRSIELEKYVELNVKNLSQMLPSSKIIGRGETRINGEEARWLLVNFDFAGTKMKSIVYIVVHNGRGYAITCSAVPVTFSRYKNRFEEIAHSFRLE